MIVTIPKLIQVAVVPWQEVDGVCQDLLRRAAQIRKHAVAYYSNYHVGAAMLWQNGFISVGCNIENCIYEVLHAERGAISNGIVRYTIEELGKIEKVAVIGGPKDKDIVIPPVLSRPFHEIAAEIKFEDACVCCGQCLQDVLEFSFGKPETVELMELLNGVVLKTTLTDLLPANFGPNHLGIDYSKPA